MLMLLLEGMWAGVRAQVTVYEDHVGAQLVVVAPVTENLFSDSSTLPRHHRTPGVDWAAPIRTLYTVLDRHGRRAAASLIRFVPGRRGGPWALAEGGPPQADDEVVVDTVLARRHDLGAGDRLDVMGAAFRVVGLSGGHQA